MPSSTTDRKTMMLGAACLAAVLLTATIGHWKGREDAEATLRGHGAAGGATDSVSSTSPEGRESRQGKSEVTSASTGAAQKRLGKLWEKHVAAHPDPEALWMTRRLVATMSSEEIEEFLRNVPTGFYSSTTTRVMRRAIIEAWAAKDAPAALAYLGQDKSQSTGDIAFETTRLMMLWTKDQPDAALDWMRSGDLTPEQEKLTEKMRLNALMTLFGYQPERAMRELDFMKPEDITRQLVLWAGLNGRDPKMRAMLLERVNASGSAKDIGEVNSAIIRAIAEADAGAARELVKKLASTEEERAALEDEVSVAAMKRDPATALGAWITENPSATELPGSISKGIGHWLSKDIGKAAAWLDTIPAGASRDTLYAHLMPNVAGASQFEMAAKMAASIGDPELKKQAMQDLLVRWDLVGPEDSAKWKSGLPEEDRELLEE